MVPPFGTTSLSRAVVDVAPPPVPSQRADAAIAEGRVGRARRLLLTPEAGVVAIALVFLAISAWWLATDLRMVNLDNGKHLLISVRIYQDFATGRLFEPFSGFDIYPPGVHVVGALASLVIGRPTIFGMVFAENLVFVPLLALGCYGTARVAFDRRAGLLAAIFALSVPLVMSMFHVLLVDAPEAAMVAMTVWLLLASDRFSRVGLAAAAGVAAGLGMYTKGTFVMFILGVVAVMLLRGGWRSWKGFAAFGIVASVIAGPWYLAHLGDLEGQTYGAVAGGVPIWYGGVPFPQRWTLHNFTWYGWNLLNNQLYLPLSLFFATGAGWSLWRLARRPWKGSLLPELLAGGFVGYFLISLLVLKDPRYSLPCLVYIAVLGTAWVVHAPRTVRLAATALLIGVLVVNTVNHNFGVGGVHRIRTPWAVNSPNAEYQFKLLNEAGFFEGGPDRRAEPLLGLLERLRKHGPNVIFDAATLSGGGYNLSGLTIFAFKAKLLLLAFEPDAVRQPQDAWVTRAVIEDVGRPPCLVSPLADDGTGIYVYRGRVPTNLRRARPDCP